MKNSTRHFNKQDERSLLEIKSILDVIIDKFKEIMTLTPFEFKLKEFMKSEYFKGMNKIDVQIKPNINLIPQNQRVLENLYNYTFQNLQKHSEDVGNTLRQELQRGLLEGDTIKELKERVKKTFNNKQINNRLKMVIRTEQNRAENMGILEGAEQVENSGIKLKKWLDVTEDKRSSDICDKVPSNKNSAVNKYGSPDKAIPLNEKFKVKGVKGDWIEAQTPPFHPNCRTVLMIVRGRD